MFIKNYGLFWRSDEVNWFPGKGARGAFRLLGREGKNLPGLRLADFRNQRGIYILYSNHGPYYTGLTIQRGLGKRLQDHQTDHHAEKWDRFSWFGFQRVLKKTDDNNICKLADLAALAAVEPTRIIRDIEALLIKAMGLTNISQTKFAVEEEWMQVKKDETEHYLDKLHGSDR